jgi:hypothetical protein
MVNGNLDLAKPCFLIEIINSSNDDLKYRLSNGILSKFVNENRLIQKSGIEKYTDINLIELNVDRRLNSPVNSAELKILNGSLSSLSVETQDRLKVWLGYHSLKSEGEPFFTLVYTGKIIEIKTGLNLTSILCSSDSHKITTRFIDRSFSKLMNLNDIIKKLVVDYGDLRVANGGIGETTICKQKGYAVSDRVSIYEHVEKLARLNSFDVYMDVNDEFNAKPWDLDALKNVEGSDDNEFQILTWIPERGADETKFENRYLFEFRYGLNIIDLQLKLSNQDQDKLVIINPIDISPAHSNYTITPVQIKSDFEPDLKTILNIPAMNSDKSLKTKILTNISKSELRDVFKNLSRQRKSRSFGKLEVIGSPQVRLGDGVKVKGINIDDKVFKITQVEHSFNMTDGFLTKIDLEEHR